jgi:hypothetical protein
MTEPDPELETVRAEMAEQKARTARLTGQYGKPGSMPPSDALALARNALVPVDPTATADDIWASVYRDDAAADGWLESNRVHHGHPTLAKVPLPDGRVVGILDLRPEMKKDHERILGHVDGNAGNDVMKDASPWYLEGYERGRQRRRRESAGGEQP